MKSLLLIALSVIMAIVISGCDRQTSDANKDQMAKAKSIGDWGNVKCPVMGEAVDKNISVVYKGKRVYLCCTNCIAMFKKNPEKYIAILKKNLAKKTVAGKKIKDWGNVKCPVMGNKIDKKIFVMYQGKRVYLCCTGCIAMFKKNPEKYIAILKKNLAGHKKAHKDQH